MGQQQLLLIVLGVIVVGIAIVVGINLFNSNAIQANRDGVVSDLNNLGAMAQQYYKKPTSMGGGGNSFTSWTIPSSLDTTANGSYSLTSAGTTVIIVGTGTEKDNGSAIQHTITVYADSMIVTQTN